MKVFGKMGNNMEKELLLIVYKKKFIWSILKGKKLGLLMIMKRLKILIWILLKIKILLMLINI